MFLCDALWSHGGALAVKEVDWGRVVIYYTCTVDHMHAQTAVCLPLICAGTMSMGALMCCGKNGSTAMTSGYSLDLLLKSETSSKCSNVQQSQPCEAA